MRRTTIHVVELIILGICFLSLGMMKAEACDCDKPRLGKTALEDADAVFSGRITKKPKKALRFQRGDEFGAGAKKRVAPLTLRCLSTTWMWQIHQPAGH